MHIKEAVCSLFKETIAGLDIGEDYISAAVVSIGENGLPRVDILGFAEKKPGLTDDAIACSITRLWHKYNIKTRTVSSCLRSPSLAIKHFKLPRLSGHELKSALYLEAEHAFQKPKDELYIDWQLCGDTEGVLVGSPKEVVKDHVAILNKAGLYPVAVDICSMAVSGLYMKLKNPTVKETVCIANLNNNFADIAVMSGDGYMYPRYIYSDSVSLCDRLDYLVENIDELLRYYQFKLRREPPGKIVFTGILSSDEDFRKKLSKAVNISSEFWNPLEEITSRSGVGMPEKNIFGPMSATSLGLAMSNG